jgi:hypothetical protein
MALKTQNQQQQQHQPQHAYYFQKSAATTDKIEQKTTQPDKNDHKSNKNLFTLKKTPQTNRIKDYKAQKQHKSLQNLKIDEFHHSKPTDHVFTCKFLSLLYRIKAFL